MENSDCKFLAVNSGILTLSFQSLQQFLATQICLYCMCSLIKTDLDETSEQFHERAVPISAFAEGWQMSELLQEESWSSMCCRTWAGWSFTSHTDNAKLKAASLLLTPDCCCLSKEFGSLKLLKSQNAREKY